MEFDSESGFVDLTGNSTDDRAQVLLLLLLQDVQRAWGVWAGWAGRWGGSRRQQEAAQGVPCDAPGASE